MLVGVQGLELLYVLVCGEVERFAPEVQEELAGSGGGVVRGR